MGRNQNHDRYFFRKGWKLPFRLMLIYLLSFLAMAGSAAEKSQYLAPSSNSPLFWIWTEKLEDKQTCRFWRMFQLPPTNVITRAQLQVTADNSYHVFLDGRDIGAGSDWRTLTTYDLTWLIEPGKKHVLAVEAFNDNDKAGVLVKLTMETTDDRVFEINSDQNWLTVPESARGWTKKTSPGANWEPAKTVGAYGKPPWWPKPITLVKVPPLRPIALHFWQRAWFQITLFSLCAVAVFISLRLMAKLALQSRAQELLQRERARIARDIHDDLGARMTQLVLQGEVLQSELPSDSKMRGQVDELCERVRDVLSGIDEIVWVVNSKRDTLKDFATYVCKYANLFLGSTAIRCRFDIEPEMPSIRLDLPIRRNLFLAVKEALNNAAKHSEATEIYLRIHRQEQSVLVVVEDNGKGFNAAEAKSERNGLTNMAQRMQEAGGVFNVTSTPGTGARIEFRLPLPETKRRSRIFGWVVSRTQTESEKNAEDLARASNS